MTADQELAELAADFEDWHIWRGRDIHGQPVGWHATLTGTRRTSVIVATDGPLELRARLEKLDRATREATHV